MVKVREVRLPETEDRYRKYLAEKRPGCPFCFKDGLERKVLEKFQYWYLTENLFPYDKLYSVNHMLVPVRHIEHMWDLNEDERNEYALIRQQLFEKSNYDELLENFPSTRTQIHYHLHLLKY